METTKKNLEQANKDLEAKEKALQAVSEYWLMFVIILPMVWCGCETWSLTLRDERRHPIQWGQGALSMKVRWPGREGDHLHSTGSGEGMN